MCKHLVFALLHVLDLRSAALDGPSNGPLLCIHHLPNNTKLICLHISVLKKKITWWNEVSFAMQIKLIHNGVYIFDRSVSVGCQLVLYVILLTGFIATPGTKKIQKIKLRNMKKSFEIQCVLWRFILCVYKGYGRDSTLSFNSKMKLLNIYTCNFLQLKKHPIKHSQYLEHFHTTQSRQK